MHRRAYLVAAAAAVGLAGCSGDGGTDGAGGDDPTTEEGPAGPEAAYVAFWEAAAAGDREEVQALIHPNAGERGVADPPESFYGFEVEVGETDILQREGNSAIVAGELTFTTEEGETQTVPGFDLEFRLHDGQWKYYHGMDWGA